jgi:hypothetical protein
MVQHIHERQVMSVRYNPRRIVAGIYAELPALTEFGSYLSSLAETPALADALTVRPFPLVVVAVIAAYLTWRCIPATLRRQKGGDA